MTTAAVRTAASKGGLRGSVWRVSEAVARVELGLATLGLMALVVLVLLQAGARVGLDLGLAWPGEASRYLFIWSSFLGGAAAVHWKEEIRVDVMTPLVERFVAPQRVSAVVLQVQRVSAFVGACFLTYFAVLCYQQVAFLQEIESRSLVMGVPMWTVAAALLVSCATGAFHYVAVLLNEPLADELLGKTDDDGGTTTATAETVAP
ncbi:TRAP transporter small permease [Mycobacterium sp. NAZ190054]|uniref:TRAP transporter small permease n=1 Tax=Mycobacterium sp. NAZ190054 TaxID=1747766 RepID=UPI0007913DAF|nr:TRAP transporter small permease subunit [Mycobacterium sp. NAZ190054]KWX57348.1 hypothetical protein ASJ79_11585 [Mycobacterium sp. NAZ190054]